MRTAFTLLLVLLAATYASAHGTGYRNSDLRAIALEFFYSDGEKMSYREARVFSPRDEKFAAQTGRTDEAGRFAFVPDCPGEWRVIVRDEEGHQCVASIAVSEESQTPQESSSQSSIPQGTELALRAILGISLIFNIAMIVRSKRNAH